MRLALGLLLIAVSFVSFSFQAQATALNLQWRTSFSYNSYFEERLAQSQGSDWNFYLKGFYPLAENARLLFLPKFRVQSGYYLGVSPEDRNAQKLSLAEANIGFENSRYFLLAGIINTGKVSQLVAKDLSYTGAQMQYLFDLDLALLGPVAQSYLIANSGSPESHEEPSSPPQFHFAGLKLQSHLLNKDIKLQLQSGLFNYQNLNSTLAERSEPLGSSVTTASGNEILFMHEYQGQESSLELSVLLPWQFTVSTQFVHAKNLQVNDSTGTAAIGHLKVSKQLSKNDLLVAQLSQFSLGANAFPASESSSFLGLNRVGQALTIGWEELKAGWSLKLQMQRANPIFLNPNQDEYAGTYLSWETTYAEI